MIYAGALYAIACLFFSNSLFHIWRINDIKRVLTGGVLFSLGMETTVNALYFGHHIIEVPLLYGSFAIWTSLSYVLVFFLLNFSFNRNFEWKKRYWVLILFLIMQVSIFTINFAKEYSQIPDILSSGIQNATLSFYPYRENYFLHSLGAILIYPYVFVLIFSKLGYKKKKEEVYFFFIFLFFLSLILVFDIYYLFQNREPEPPSGLIMAITYFSIYLFVILYQFWPYYHKLNYIYLDLNAIGISSYMRSHLDKVNIKALAQQFKNLEKNEELYKNENFNLQSLAEKLNLSVHQTSEYLNKYKNISFTKYLNQLRVEAAKDLLSDQNNKSIIEICYEIGYNSPAVFYKAFKEITGVSPKIWREKQLLNNKIR